MQRQQHWQHPRIIEQMENQIYKRRFQIYNNHKYKSLTFGRL